MVFTYVGGCSGITCFSTILMTLINFSCAGSPSRSWRCVRRPAGSWLSRCRTLCRLQKLGACSKHSVAAHFRPVPVHGHDSHTGFRHVLLRSSHI